ncbi:fimbrial protein [Pluralibacter gergoviae]|uniref:fimbrial protein n=1 Tax=Pluralibacter gergoviae TaxID=61647 RepID=UPI0004F7A2BD|nr:fimbrial protein [Pluralibacter gergoviae]AIQ99673.1 fimbrial protein [Pluralibacter gergoviae]
MFEWRVLLLLFFAPLFSFKASADKSVTTPGKVHMSGELIEAACYVDPDDQSILVEFNDISAREITQSRDKVSVHNFSIHLLGCSLGDSANPDKVFHSTSITFSGNVASNNKKLLSVQAKDNQEEDLAIEIFDRNGNLLELGKPSPDYVLNSGTNTLHFTAWLVSTGSGIKTGDFNAAVHFVVNYL